ncbi:MAG: MerC domain-containing protein [Saprospiraceae bacterium]
MKQKFISTHLDFLGFSASMLCALHCMAIPLVMTIGALSGLAWLENPWIEATFIGLSFVIATWSLTRSYLLHHHHLTAIRIVALGFALILVSRFVEHHWEPIFAAVGGITIAGAHWKNWQLQKKCTRCA